MNSAGNIYYYFANKEAILVELRDSLTKDAATNLRQSKLLGLKTAALRHKLAADWLEIVWKWRFFFLDIHQFVRQDAKAKVHFYEMQQNSINIHQILIEDYLTDRGMIMTDDDHQFSVSNHAHRSSGF